VLGVVTGTTAVLTACGSGLSTGAMRPDAARQLQSDVLVLTQQAAARNWQGARTALSTLRADLDASVSAGAISPQRAEQIEATIAQVAGEIPAAVTPTPTPTRSTTTTTRKPAPAPAPPKKHKHGHGGDD
jgi:hypothetical protein